MATITAVKSFIVQAPGIYSNKKTVKKQFCKDDNLDIQSDLIAVNSLPCLIMKKSWVDGIVKMLCHRISKWR